MQEQLYNMLMQKDEITWQSIIYDLINSGELDPWDINISLLAKRYLQAIKKLQESHFFVSGKMILASAILLRLKSDKLLTEFIAAFDSRLFGSEEEFEEDIEEGFKQRMELIEHPKLTIKNPQLRKKKVGVNDLVKALEKALNVNERRILRKIERERVPEHIVIPEKPIDVSVLIKELYKKIEGLFRKKEKISFSMLVPSQRKEDKITTFVPLLHLDNQGKVTISQEKHFGEIDVVLNEQRFIKE